MNKQDIKDIEKICDKVIDEIKGDEQMKKIKDVDINPYRYDYAVAVTFEDDSSMTFYDVEFKRGNHLSPNDGIGMTLSEFKILLNSHNVRKIS